MNAPPLSPQPSALSPVPASSSPLVSVRDLQVHFPIHRGVLGRTAGWIRAVDGVSFDIPRGQTLGLVGESGCGKTTTGRAILRLVPATAGRVLFDGADVLALPQRALRVLRRRMQIVFQDPWSSLDPRMTVETIVGEPLAVHRGAAAARALDTPRQGEPEARSSRRQRRELVSAVLERVGLGTVYLTRYPHELSGGQRQRVSIARAIVLSPDLVVCDECVSALDVSVQAQILNLLSDLQRDLGLTYLFIAHHLAVVRHLSDRIVVMYLGRIVELGDRRDIFDQPRHPYTQALLAAVPSLAPAPSAAAGRRIPLAGEVPGPADVPSGCAFRTRCPIATNLCCTTPPPLEPRAGLGAGHLVACHYAGNGPPTLSEASQKD